MKKAKLIPLVTLVGGLAGLVVRRFYMTHSFEPDTGLPISGTPIEAAMWVLCLVVAIVLLVLSSGKHQDFETRYAAAFTPRGMAGRTVLLAGAFLFLAAAVLNVVGFAQGTTDFLGQRSVGWVRLVLAAVALVAGVAVIATAMAIAAGREPRRELVSMPGFAGCLWVMANYQEWARSPITANYYLELLALLLAMVACTLLASFAFGKGKVGGALFFAGEAAAFCIMILGDGMPLYDVAMALGMAFYLLAMLEALAHNDGIPLPPLPQTGPSCAGCPSAAPDGSCASAAPDGSCPSAPQNAEGTTD